MGRLTGHRRERRKPKHPPVTMPRQLLVAYTDGSTYKRQPGPISWAVVFVRDHREQEVLSGALYTGTNNRAEMMGVIAALEHCRGEDLLIRTDSQLLVNCMSGICARHSNLDLWRRLEAALSVRRGRGLMTEVEHVKGHAYDRWNARADHVARAAAIRAAPLTPLDSA